MGKRSRNKEDKGTHLRNKIMRMMEKYEKLKNKPDPECQGSIEHVSLTSTSNDDNQTIEDNKENQDASIHTPKANEQTISHKVDEEARRALGYIEKKSEENKKLHPDLNDIMVEWLTQDKDKNMKDDIFPKYPRKIENCFIEAPKLNLEIKSKISESVAKRDNHFMDNQNIAGTALVSLSAALNMLLTDEDEDIDKYDLIEKLSDSVKLTAQLHHNFSLARKAYITPTLNNELRAMLDESKPGLYLYGEELLEKVKSATAIAKVGDVLLPKVVSKTANKSLNFKAPSARQWKSSQGGERTYSSSRINFRQNARTTTHQLPHHRPTSRTQGTRQSSGGTSSKQMTRQRR